MRSLSRVFLRLLVVGLLIVTLFAPTATATGQSAPAHARKGIIARILDYVLPDISLPPG
jgi:hypothetical protein